MSFTMCNRREPDFVIICGCILFSAERGLTIVFCSWFIYIYALYFQAIFFPSTPQTCHSLAVHQMSSDFLSFPHHLDFPIHLPHRRLIPSSATHHIYWPTFFIPCLYLPVLMKWPNFISSSSIWVLSSVVLLPCSDNAANKIFNVFV